MKQHLWSEFTSTLTSEQLLAIYDLCQIITENLWLRHEQALLEQMIEQHRINGQTALAGTANDNLELPFDDELPF